MNMPKTNKQKLLYIKTKRKISPFSFYTAFFFFFLHFQKIFSFVYKEKEIYDKRKNIKFFFY